MNIKGRPLNLSTVLARLKVALQTLNAILEEIVYGDKPLHSMPIEAQNKPAPSNPALQAPSQPLIDTLRPWDNIKGSENNKHNVRVLCDLAGLDLEGKNIITACITVESDFLPRVEGRLNKNGTHDWGICQFNDGYLRHVPLWIGPGAAFANVEEVLDNPEKCVNLMIAEFKAGHIGWWVSFSSEEYKDYMPGGRFYKP